MTIKIKETVEDVGSSIIDAKFNSLEGSIVIKDFGSTTGINVYNKCINDFMWQVKEEGEVKYQASKLGATGGIFDYKIQMLCYLTDSYDSFKYDITNECFFINDIVIEPEVGIKETVNIQIKFSDFSGLKYVSKINEQIKMEQQSMTKLVTSDYYFSDYGLTTVSFPFQDSEVTYYTDGLVTVSKDASTESLKSSLCQPTSDNTVFKCDLSTLSGSIDITKISLKNSSEVIFNSKISNAQIYLNKTLLKSGTDYTFDSTYSTIHTNLHLNTYDTLNMCITFETLSESNAKLVLEGDA